VGIDLGIIHKYNKSMGGELYGTDKA